MAALILCDGSLHIHAKYNHFKGETNSIDIKELQTASEISESPIKIQN